MKIKLIYILLFLSLLVPAGCRKKEDSPRITIADQYGLAYAPLQIMREKQFLEKLHPGIEVSWVRLGNTAAIREAVLTGDVDAGFLGIPPFLIARDKKMPWKIATGLSQSPLGLVVADEEIQDVNDFVSGSRLALPQPGSIQHILLSMALEKEFGDHDKLDHALVSMKHPDGMNALLNGSIQGHFTSPPYLFQETDQEGYSVLISGEKAMGEAFTFIVGMATEEFHQSRPEIYRDYLKAVQMAVDFINDLPVESVRILSEAYKMDEEKLMDYLYRPGMVFETEVRGLGKFIDFMTGMELIRNISSPGEVLF